MGTTGRAVSSHFAAGGTESQQDEHRAWDQQPTWVTGRAFCPGTAPRLKSGISGVSHSAQSGLAATLQSQSPGRAQGADKTSPSCLLFVWGRLPRVFQKQSVLGWVTVPSHICPLLRSQQLRGAGSTSDQELPGFGGSSDTWGAWKCLPAQASAPQSGATLGLQLFKSSS